MVTNGLTNALVGPAAWRKCVLGLALAWACVPMSAWAKPVALLVGVGNYEHVPKLQGPEYDVQALSAVLQKRWGFQARDVQTLVDAQATRANIMAALGQLLARSAPGDEVLVYLSGHGTSALDSIQKLDLVSGTGAFVPVDFQFAEKSRSTDGLIVGRRDLRPIFTGLEAGGRKVLLVADACYSGQIVRSLQLDAPEKLPDRWMAWPTKSSDDLSKRDNLNLTQAAAAPEPYPYKTVMFLSAAAENEKAKDLPRAVLNRYPTLDKQPHGAMTDALLRVLEGDIPADFNGDGVLDLYELHRSVADFMDSRSYGHTPQRLPSVAEDRQGLGTQPAFSARNKAAKPVGLVQSVALRIAVAQELDASLHKAVQGVPDVAVQRLEDGPADVYLKPRSGDWALLSAGGDLVRQVAAGQIDELLGSVRQMAWSHRVRQLAVAHRRAGLPVDVLPVQSGGNLYYGQKVAFAVQPDKAATLVLLNINSDGKVSVLYPSSGEEARPAAARQSAMIPSADLTQGIDVTPPEGMDVQFAFAFDEPLPQVDRLFGVADVNVDDARLAQLERWLTERKGRFSFASTSTRAVPKAGAMSQ